MATSFLTLPASKHTVFAQVMPTVCRELAAQRAWGYRARANVVAVACAEQSRLRLLVLVGEQFGRLARGPSGARLMPETACTLLACRRFDQWIVVTASGRQPACCRR